MIHVGHEYGKRKGKRKGKKMDTHTIAPLVSPACYRPSDIELFACFNVEISPMEYLWTVENKRGRKAEFDVYKEATITDNERELRIAKHMERVQRNLARLAKIGQ